MQAFDTTYRQIEISRMAELADLQVLHLGHNVEEAKRDLYFCE